IFADSERDFWTKYGAHYTFVLDEQGGVTGIVEHVSRTLLLPWTRVDTATAQQIRAGVEAKFQSQLPTPGGEITLRRLLDGLLLGNPDYDAMTPWVAQSIRANLDFLQSMQTSLGQVRSLAFSHVNDTGGDVYEARTEGRRAEFAIYLNSQGLI